MFLGWGFLEFSGAVVGGLVLLYSVARMVSAAAYKSKMDYDRMRARWYQSGEPNTVLGPNSSEEDTVNGVTKKKHN